MSVNSEKRKNNRVIILMALFVVLIFLLGLFLLHRWEEREEALLAEAIAAQNEDGERLNQVRYRGKWYKENTDIETILLIGVDKFSNQIFTQEDDFRNDQQADFLALILRNVMDNTYQIIFLDRDTIADVPMLDVTGEEYDTGEMQLALAHTYGNGGRESCRNTAQAVSNLLYGVRIDHYISVTMDTVALLNDAVGGVTVYVEDDFSAEDPTIVQGQEVTLFGDHALHFVSARFGMEDPTNMARMNRQHTYLKALRTKAMERIAQDDSFLMSMLLSMSEYMESDCTVERLSTYLDVVSRSDEPEVLTLKGEVVEGEQFTEYHVDEEALQEMVVDLFYVPAE